MSGLIPFWRTMSSCSRMMYLLLSSFLFLVIQWELTDKQQMSYAASSPCNQKVEVKSGREERERNKWEHKKSGSIRNLYVQLSAEWHIKANCLNYKVYVVNCKIKFILETKSISYWYVALSWSDPGQPNVLAVCPWLLLHYTGS